MGLVFRKSLGAGAEIALWHITESECGLLDLLSEDIPERDACADRGVLEDGAYGRHSGEIDRILSVRSEALRRQKLSVLVLIGILTGGRCSLAHHPDGKPYLVYNDDRGIPPRISVTHTKDYAAVIVSRDMEPGIDMESALRDFGAVGRRALSAGETAWLSDGHFLRKNLRENLQENPERNLKGKPKENPERNLKGNQQENPEGNPEGNPRGNPETEAAPEGGRLRNLSLGLIWCAKESVYKVIGSKVTDFAAGITLLPFEPAAEGSLKALFSGGGLDLRYIVRDGLILVWTEGLHI